MAKITKERLQNVADAVNAGTLPSYAARNEKLSGVSLKALRRAGIIALDETTDTWFGRNVTDARFQRYIQTMKSENKKGTATRKAKSITVENKAKVKIGYFSRVWNAILNKKDERAR